MQLKITKPLAELQDDNYAKVRSDLYEFITETSDFPEWKQVNYADTYSELSIKKLESGVSAAEQDKIDNILLIRAWKNDLLTERDRVKTLIYSAANISEIRTAVSGLVLTPPPTFGL